MHLAVGKRDDLRLRDFVNELLIAHKFENITYPIIGLGNVDDLLSKSIGSGSDKPQLRDEVRGSCERARKVRDTLVWLDTAYVKNSAFDGIRHPFGSELLTVTPVQNGVMITIRWKWCDFIDPYPCISEVIELFQEFGLNPIALRMGSQVVNGSNHPGAPPTQSEEKETEKDSTRMNDPLSPSADQKLRPMDMKYVVLAE